MTSPGLTKWSSDRRARIDELLDVHQLIGSKRRWGTGQINSALVLRLAAEFQGFCRELHDLAAEYFVAKVAEDNSDVAEVIEEQLIKNRKLDRGNANPGALSNDFSRLGLSLWRDLEKIDPDALTWNRSLEALNDVRNAIAHADEGKLARLKEQGYPVTLQAVRNWLTALDSLAAAMDDAVSIHLDGLLGGGQPW